MSTKTIERLLALAYEWSRSWLSRWPWSLKRLQQQSKAFFWAPGQAPNPSSVSNDLIYHGGNAGRSHRRRRHAGDLLISGDLMGERFYDH